MAITKIQCLNEAHTGNPVAHLKNALSYIQNPEKTEENVMVGSINCLPDTAFEQMMDDMSNGDIAIISTKDLSRLVRNQLYTVLYIE